MSGDALNKIQLSPSLLTAIEDWVRGVKPLIPVLTFEQFEQLQFHCETSPSSGA